MQRHFLPPAVVPPSCPVNVRYSLRYFFGHRRSLVHGIELSLPKLGRCIREIQFG
jgi:hypothetical protein